MPKFKVEIEEILQRVEEVEAKNLEEAIDIIDEKYDNQEIILDSEDFKGHEIREFKEEVRIEDLEKDLIFDLKYGKAILLEGNKNVALLKKLGVEDYPYVVATGLAVSKYKTYFEWNQGSYYGEITSAIEKYNDLKEIKNEKVQNDLIYSELGKATLENHNILKFENLDETFDYIYDCDVTKEELVEQLTEKMKEDLSFQYANERLIKEDGKYYYGEELYFFEEEINEKTRKIDTILNELNIKNIKPYDVIELLEQAEISYEPIDEKLINEISNAMKLAGYDRKIQDFINYINEELTKEDEEVEENEI